MSLSVLTCGKFSSFVRAEIRFIFRLKSFITYEHFHSALYLQLLAQTNAIWMKSKKRYWIIKLSSNSFNMKILNNFHTLAKCFQCKMRNIKINRNNNSFFLCAPSVFLSPNWCFLYAWLAKKCPVFHIFTVSASGQINAINIFVAWTPSTWFISTWKCFFVFCALCPMPEKSSVWKRERESFMKFSLHKKVFFGWRWQNIGKVNMEKWTYNWNCCDKITTIRFSFSVVNGLIRAAWNAFVGFPIALINYAMPAIKWWIGGLVSRTT